MEDINKLRKQLRLSCEEGAIAPLKAVLKKFPKLLETADNKGTTLLGIAVKKEQLEVAEYLLSLGADIDAVNNVILSLDIFSAL